MLFSTPVFLFLFLPLCLAAYYAAGRSNAVLLGFSLLFYAWGEPVLVLVMVATIVVNYLLGLAIERSRRRGEGPAKALLVAGLGANLLLLGYYKYFNFFAELINGAAAPLALPRIGEAQIPLLLGVSFFSFQAMSYLIDVYRRDYPAQTNVFRFALFKTLFPQLIAGPIVRYSEFGPQFSGRRHDWASFAAGVERFTIGLAKKVLIADVCAVSVDRMFGLPAAEMSGSIAWSATLLFALQIYFDFSGYTDMALGLGRMFGFHLPENFDHPYAARSVQDFWRRWHMTLSRWFRDYLYIPLGGSRHGPLRTAFNLFVVFLLCGLWHGANMTFVVWGLLHGLFLALERTAFGRWLERWPALLRHGYVLLVVVLSWMVFRATSLEQAGAMGRAMLGLNGWSDPHHALRLYTDTLTWLSAACGVLASFPWRGRIRWSALPALPLWRTGTLAATFVICIAFLGAQTHRAFIYFRF
ncbi:MBOAT family protein [Aquincola sp. S2]|uniref:Probable alginate O-acetylase AlgI n=1 Tax=Pseudaquabacterium terrae TaxID=2732868 RepID=A0ABX2EN74_9BURK|nr:MBOAT family O-acyltransferase [Aquabacterium terrae]NRF70018.1 MBOAT family protein [Aquabacterium terrae]